MKRRNPADTEWFDLGSDLVARLDALQAQLDTLQALQRQSDSNARYILESYLGASVDATVQELVEDVIEDEPPSEELVNELVLCKRQKVDE